MHERNWIGPSDLFFSFCKPAKETKNYECTKTKKKHKKKSRGRKQIKNDLHTFRTLDVHASFILFSQDIQLIREKKKLFAYKKSTSTRKKEKKTVKIYIRWSPYTYNICISCTNKSEAESKIISLLFSPGYFPFFFFPSMISFDRARLKSLLSSPFFMVFFASVQNSIYILH